MMALDKLVDSTQLDSDLTDVADEIRTAGGTLLPLSFPDDYVVAIGDIGNTEIKTASGSIAHFEDALARKAQDLTVAIEPVQDLHGYDNPWPAGGGKNLLTALPSPGTTVWFCEPDGFLFKANQTYCFSIGDDVAVGSYSIYAADKTTQLAYAASNRKVVYTPTVDTVGYPRLYAGEGVSQEAINSAQLELGDSRTTFAPYSNICPISGWTGANVTRANGNLFASTWESGVWDTSGNKGTSNSIVRTANKIPVKPGVHYAIHRSVTTSYINVRCFDKNGVYIGLGPGWVNLIQGETGATAANPMQTNASSCVISFKPGCWYSAINDMSNDVNTQYVMVAGDTVSADFVSPSSDTYSITFPSEAGTVYGGTLDVTTGKLTVDRAMVDLGTLTWENRYTETNNKTILSHLPLMLPHAQNRKIISENYKYHGFVVATAALQHPDSLDVGLRTYYMTDYPQSDDVVYAVIPVSESPDGLLVYELATPIVYDLTPTEITTLLGTNNVWADAGDSTIKYIAPKVQIPSAQGVYF